MYSKEFAKEILQFNDEWQTADKITIINNVDKYLYEKYPMCEKSIRKRTELIIEFTESKKQTVYSWFNKGRENVKIPLFKLCKLAVALDVRVEKFLESQKDFND